MLSTSVTAEMHDRSAAEITRRRNRSIRLAVATSFISKFGTILLQLVSIPIAIRVLGRAEFGIYAMVNLTLGTISLLQVGVGPALTHGLARARAAGDAEGQREHGSTAFFLMAGISLLAGLALAGILLAVPVPALFGGDFAGSESELRPALWTGLGLFLLLFVLNLTERVREGHLEVAANNLWGAAGNVLAAAAVGIGVWFVPEVWFIVIAVHGAMVVTKICNTAALWKKHPLMRPSPKYFRPAVAEAMARGDLPWARNAAKRLYRYGSAFAVCSAIGLATVGPWVMPIWLGDEFAGTSRLLLAAYGLYFIAHVWRHLNHAMMIGTGQVGKLVRIQLVESTVVACLGALALHFGGMEAMLATMAVVILALTGTFLPKQVARVLNR